MASKIKKESPVIPDEFRLKVGDPVTVCGYTDRAAAEVVEVAANGKTAWIRMCKQELLNGVNSGESDALRFHPGGFHGHTEGRQRYKIESNPEGEPIKFTARPTMRKVWSDEKKEMVPIEVWVWKISGSPTKGGTNPLAMGHSPYYDFNF